MKVDSTGSETPKTTIWQPEVFGFTRQLIEDTELTLKSFFIAARNATGNEVIINNIRLKTAGVSATADITISHMSMIIQ